MGCVDGYKSGRVVIRDCIFTGTVNSSGSYNGCFVGFINSGGSATVSNCLSLGTFNYTGRSYDIARGSYSNCYVLQWPGGIPASMQCNETTLTDGTIVTALQAGRSESVWKQDAFTGMPMLTLFADQYRYKVPASAKAGVKMPANKAYLQILTSALGAGAPGITLLWDDGTTTGISTLIPALLQEEGVWYPLDGRKLNRKPTKKGLYIHRGRKVLMK